MKTKYKIPKGWQRIRKDMILKEGDKWKDFDNDLYPDWYFTRSVGAKIGGPGSANNGPWDVIYIRKIKK